MNKINICLDSKIWIRKLPNIEKIVKKILQKSISSEKKITNSNVEVTILLTNTKKIAIQHKAVSLFTIIKSVKQTRDDVC